MNELSIIIPTIGRESILDTLRSVMHPNIHEYLIVDDSKEGIPEELKSSIHGICHEATFLTTVGGEGPGFTKSMGISSVTSDYFLIIDDDDQLVGDQSISVIMDVLRDLRPNWVSFHWGSKKTDPYDVKMRYLSQGDLMDWLFDFSHYNPEGNFDVVYPGSSVVFNTKKFREQDTWMHHKYADDALSASLFMYRNSGVDLLMNLGQVGHTTGSVSRGLPDEQDVRFALEEIRDYRDKDFSPFEKEFLDKVLDNIFKRLNHIGFNKISRDEFAPK